HARRRRRYGTPVACSSLVPSTTSNPIARVACRTGPEVPIRWAGHREAEKCLGSSGQPANHCGLATTLVGDGSLGVAPRLASGRRFWWAERPTVRRRSTLPCRQLERWNSSGE